MMKDCISSMLVERLIILFYFFYVIWKVNYPLLWTLYLNRLQIYVFFGDKTIVIH